MSKRIQTLLAIILFGIAAKGQGIPLGETILINASPIKENVDPEVFKKVGYDPMFLHFLRDQAGIKNVVRLHQSFLRNSKASGDGA